jgi:hypothetical protein
VGIKTLHWIEFGQHISFEELVGLEIELGMHQRWAAEKGWSISLLEKRWWW